MCVYKVHVSKILHKHFSALPVYTTPPQLFPGILKKIVSALRLSKSYSVLSYHQNSFVCEQVAVLF